MEGCGKKDFGPGQTGFKPQFSHLTLLVTLGKAFHLFFFFLTAHFDLFICFLSFIYVFVFLLYNTVLVCHTLT